MRGAGRGRGGGGNRTSRASGRRGLWFVTLDDEELLVPGLAVETLGEELQRPP